MAINNKTFQSILNITHTANEDITPFRFVDYAGNLAADNERALGIADINYTSGEKMSLTVLGVAIIETSGAIAKGQNVTSAINGKGRLAVGAENVLGRALDASTGSDFIRILLVQ